MEWGRRCKMLTSNELEISGFQPSMKYILTKFQWHKLHKRKVKMKSRSFRIPILRKTSESLFSLFIENEKKMYWDQFKHQCSNTNFCLFNVIRSAAHEKKSPSIFKR